MTVHREAPDDAQRQAAIHARGVNVIADAGAGTGKTTILVARLVEMVAPADDGPAVALSRIAAITFTRKAAGELKLRIREALLKELSRSDLTALRRDRLTVALGTIDTAYVGTIHSFADRLLRLRPIEARLSPSYEIVEEADDLVSETFSVFLQAVEAGSLASELASAVDGKVAAEAESTIVDALGVRVRPETVTFEHGGELAGLDRLFARFIETRDVRPVVPMVKKPDLGKFRDIVDEFAGFAKGSKGDGAGSRFIARANKRFQRLKDEQEPAAILAELRLILASTPDQMRKKWEFPEDDAGWKAWKAFGGDTNKDPVRATPLYVDLLRPFQRWMGRRLARAAPAVVAMYEKVKARHGVVDQVDLLLQLRNLLRDRIDVRGDYQALFDHVFVDEFQDTDPLQAEIVLYLCEGGAKASTWRDVQLEPGKLTIVGDPKQSIYRFRRADIAVYAEVRAIVERGPHLVAKLGANFRSEPALIAWLNHRFDEVLGASAGDGPVFDSGAGTVVNEHLLAGREGGEPACVQLIPLAAEGGKKPAFRVAEAKALAAYLRWLVEGEKRQIVDPATGERRPAGYGDIAVLVASTTNVNLLFSPLDELGVPYAARGGKLFLADPLHRQFLLGLRAIADRDDGVAQAALLRPPFFALDYDDIARERAADEGSTHRGVLRARAALELVQELRRRRLDRSPGTTARDLLERTGFGRAAALGPNGAQRLDALRELCHALDTVAASDGLDYDAATSRLRGWAMDPEQLDPPRPVGSDAVQILSVHQAKGLEFPIVIWWDACADLDAFNRPNPWSIDRDGASWVLNLDGIDWEEPDGAGVAEREKKYLDAEHLRLVYVAATRARDLLVLPVAGEPKPGWITGRLVGGAPAELMRVLDPYAVDAEPAWAKELPAPAPRQCSDASSLAAAVGASWSKAVEHAASPLFSPTAVTAESHSLSQAQSDEGQTPQRRRISRFGAAFGETVHRAIGIALGDPALSAEAALERAALTTRLAEHRAEAVEDVRRALAALEKVGLRRAPGPDLQLEYPVALAADGKLVAGYVDLLGMRGGRLAVVDFKTDAPPPGSDTAQTHAAYVAQVRTYARILEELGLAAPGTVEAGLLFTTEGEVRWVLPG